MPAAGKPAMFKKNESKSAPVTVLATALETGYEVYKKNGWHSF